MTETSSKGPWSYDGAVICKKCKKMHCFWDFGNTEADIDHLFKFPNGDTSLVMIPCIEAVTDPLYPYKYEELLMPAATRTEAKLLDIDERLKAVETRIGELASKNDLTEAKTQLKEAFAGFTAERMSKQSDDPSKKAPYQ